MNKKLLAVAKSGALLGAGVLLLWKHVANSACWRTPWGELSGNPLLRELLVPSVFLIRAVAVLDAGLSRFIQENGLAISKKYLKRGRFLDLDGRINVLADNKRLSNAPNLHKIRAIRNQLAHDSLSELGWDVFEQAAQEIEQTLCTLSLTMECEEIREFRTAARLLKRPAHKKFYFGAAGMMLAAVGEGLTVTFAIHLIALALTDTTGSPILGFFLEGRETRLGK